MAWSRQWHLGARGAVVLAAVLGLASQAGGFLESDMMAGLPPGAEHSRVAFVTPAAGQVVAQPFFVTAGVELAGGINYTDWRMCYQVQCLNIALR